MPGKAAVYDGCECGDQGGQQQAECWKCRRGARGGVEQRQPNTTVPEEEEGPYYPFPRAPQRQ